MISSKPKAGNIQPSKDANGIPFTTNKELASEWHTFMEKKFSCADTPSAVLTLDIEQVSDEEDNISREEFNNCASSLRTERALGIDETPIEVYVASPAAKEELFTVVQLIWRTENVPTNLVHTVLIML